MPASTDAPSDGVELLVSTRVQELVFFRTHNIAFGGLFLCATTQMCDQILFFGVKRRTFFFCVRKDEKEKEGQNREEEEEERERPRRRSREEETLKKCCTSVVVSWYFSYI